MHAQSVLLQDELSDKRISIVPTKLNLYMNNVLLFYHAQNVEDTLINKDIIEKRTLASLIKKYIVHYRLS